MKNSYEVVRPDEPKRSGRRISFLSAFMLAVISVIYFLYGDLKPFENDNLTDKSTPEKIKETKSQIGNAEQNDTLESEKLEFEYEKKIDILKSQHLAERQQLFAEISILERGSDKSRTDALFLKDKIEKLESDLKLTKLNLDRALLKIEQTDFKLEQARSKPNMTNNGSKTSEKVGSSSSKQIAKLDPKNSVGQDTPKEPLNDLRLETVTDYSLIFAPPPKFPKKARQRDKEGSVRVEYTIMVSGNVTNVRLIKENPRGYDFGKESLKAAKKLKYTPRKKNGVPIVTTGVTREYKFAFGN